MSGSAPLPEQAERFLAKIEVERRLSPRTLSAYRDDLHKLMAYLANSRSPLVLSELRPQHLRGFAAAEHRSGLSAASIKRRLAACRSLFRFLLREGEASINPADGVRAPKTARRLPNVLDADEVGGLLDLPPDAPLAIRDRAILELFYSSALRLSELCGLRWHDLDLDDGLVRVTGKGNKTRIVPVGRLAREALLAWRGQMQTAPAQPAGFVFAGRGGKGLSPRAVQSRLKHWARSQGVWKRVHPHLLRHSCASHLLESSGNLRAVQEMLGHADISTTQIYTHLDFQHLARVYDGAHPRARRKA